MRSVSSNQIKEIKHTGKGVIKSSTFPFLIKSNTSVALIQENSRRQHQLPENLKHSLSWTQIRVWIRSVLLSFPGPVPHAVAAPQTPAKHLAVCFHDLQPSAASRSSSPCCKSFPASFYLTNLTFKRNSIAVMNKTKQITLHYCNI